MKKCIIIAALLIAFTSCRFLGGERISGNGHVISQQRNAGSFNSIRAGGAMNVHITQDATSSVKIEGDENLMQYIDVYTEGSTLVVREKQGFNLQPSKDFIIHVAAPVFKDIDVSGAGNVVGENTITSNDALRIKVSGAGDITMDVNVNRIETDISGSGKVSIRGTAKDFDAQLSGAGGIHCFDLATENTKIDLSGAANAQVNASKTLDIEVSGAGDVEYKGAANVSQKISGAGSVKKVG